VRRFALGTYETNLRNLNYPERLLITDKMQGKRLQRVQYLYDNRTPSLYTMHVTNKHIVLSFNKHNNRNDKSISTQYSIVMR